MKKLIFLALILCAAIATNAGNTYIFTETRQSIYDPVTWIFNEIEQSILIKSETEDVILCYNGQERTENDTINRYFLSDGNCIEVDRETLEIRYIISGKVFLFN